MFWAWLLKYSSFLLTGVVSFIVGYVLYRLTNKRSDLISYTSHLQWVTIPAQQGQAPNPPIGTFTLFLWNAGKAPAKDVQIGHYWLPASNVYPDLSRHVSQTPGGSSVLKFDSIPPKTLVSISYLFYGVFTVDQIISYVNWEQGTAKKIPVRLQRVFPKWVNAIVGALLFAGLWVAVNATASLVRFLWLIYYK